jgi:Fe-Mn family superoxide dismutase
MNNGAIMQKNRPQSKEAEGGPKAGLFTLIQLPFKEDALEPSISAHTISFHYGKHHAGYVKTLNKLVEGTVYSGLPLEEVIIKSAKEPKAVAIFHNAAQVWNHNFYWLSMDAKGGGEPSGALKVLIEKSFGTFQAFREVFSKAALGAFGSGWIWLVINQQGKLEILATQNADTPITGSNRPLITLDVWEHAYYLDFQNRRTDYIDAWFDRLVNWRFAEKNMGTDTKRSA